MSYYVKRYCLESLLRKRNTTLYEENEWVIGLHLFANTIVAHQIFIKERILTER
jgi:hypothetical protein